jgi:hypothetical protein
LQNCCVNLSVINIPYVRSDMQQVHNTSSTSTDPQIRLQNLYILLTAGGQANKIVQQHN